MAGIKQIFRDSARDAAVVADIEAVLHKGELPRAVQMARTALDQGLIHPMLLNLRSYWHSQSGRPADALSDLRIALQMAPGDVFVRNALGLLLVHTGKWQEALPLMEETVRMAPGFAPAQYSLGWIYAFSGELAAARNCFEAAIAIDPNFVDALGHLASLASRRADWAETSRLATRALTIDSNQPVALTALAAASLAQGNLEGAEALLSRLGDVTNLPPLEASLALTVRGDLRDAQGRFREAFDIYAARNRAKFLQAAPQYDIEGGTTHDYVSWLTHYFTALPENGWAGTPQTVTGSGGTRRHVFLVGFPRSGTTLLENILASHPDICALDERDTLGEAARAFLANDAGLSRLAEASPDEMEQHRLLYWTRVREFGGDVAGKVYVDKYPLSSIKLPLVARLFPEARILFAVRDPRDVLLSCFRRSFSLNSSMFELLNLERGARLYSEVMDLSAIYRRKLGLAWHQLRYESLVEDFDGEMGKVCDFLGVEWNDRMRDFAELARARTIKTPSSVQVLRGLYREGAGQWRRYEEQLAPVLPILQPWIDAYGYGAA
jgi:tetratricopeptide (TPR) repeat protein